MTLVDQAGAGQTHLALTGLREFWPENQPVWLVSPSCIPRPPLDHGDPLVAGVIAYPWTQADLPQVHRESRALFDKVLSFLTERLNALHGVQYSRAYWRRVIGPWLFYYVNLVFHHYASLCMARESLGAVACIGLDEASYVTPASTLEYLHEATDDAYNLQLYTRLCLAMGVRIIEYRKSGAGRLTASDNPESLPRRKGRLSSRLANRALRELRKRGQRILGPRADILLRRSFLPSGFEWKLVTALRGRVWAHHDEMYQPRPNGARRAAMRAALVGCDAGEGELAKVLGSFLVDDVPRVFVEEYADLVHFAERSYSHYSPRVVLSTASWDADEAFGHFAGKRAEAGAQLVGGECSAIFGIERDSQILEFERSHVDLYLTWGWSDPHDSRCIPTPANRLIDVRERRRPLNGKGILYAGTVALRFPVIARPEFSGYFDLQRRFFYALPSALRPEFRVRLHVTDYGWGTERRLKAAFPDLIIDRWERPFDEALYASRLYVCDHLSTTWAVALASNTPSVIFWDPVFTPLRPEMQPFFDKARAAGFVHETPESAAQWISRVYPNVEEWWFDESTQRALHEFKYNVARVTDDPLKDWVTLLSQLVSEHDWKDKRIPLHQDL